MGRVLRLLALAAVLSQGPAALAAREPSLKSVLSRMETYLARYETELATLVADERYEQSVQPRGGAPTLRRTLDSEFGFLRLPGRPEWLGLRDTVAVDGQPVPSRGRGRLDELLSNGAPDQETLARRIVEDNARYNLGLVTRTINVPMLALDFLGRRNRDRLSFQKRGEETVIGRVAWAVTFTERKRPTLVKAPDGRDRPAHGTVWVDPADGSVLRTEIRFEERSGNDLPASTITVTYRRETTLGLLVPDEMREVYRSPGAGDADELDAAAHYTNFRQFRTSARIVPR